jgi:hypothetical protein
MNVTRCGGKGRYRALELSNKATLPVYPCVHQPRSSLGFIASVLIELSLSRYD